MTNTKKGSGRTAGAVSYVSITLAELNRKFADTNTPITVRRKWAEACGFTSDSVSVSNVTGIIIPGQDTQTQVAATVTELED